MASPRSLFGALAVVAALAGGFVAAVADAKSRPGTASRTHVTKCRVFSASPRGGKRVVFLNLMTRGVSCTSTDGLLRAYVKARAGSQVNGYACHAKSEKRAGAIITVGSCVKGAKVVSFTETAPA